MAETQNDPLLPGYSFNAHLVTGLTPIDADGYLDFFIDRPLGMKGYILNLTVRGEGVINNHDEQFICRPGDILLFPPGEIHHYGRHPDAREWYHQWVYFRPRAYWHEWLNWPTIFAQTGFFRPDEQWQARFCELFGQIVEAGQGPDAIRSCWRSICSSSCCYGAWRRLMSLCIRRWTIACAMPASTSAITSRIAISISPASPSMSVCLLRACPICSASSWVSACWGGGKTSASARRSCCSVPRVCPSPR
ncbi:Arabinose operon regulatory protein [Raoultella ornithinolytica]|nr:Arabinose operon regulatory protein [Raoultella ornithinolytica]